MAWIVISAGVVLGLAWVVSAIRRGRGGAPTGASEHALREAERLRGTSGWGSGT